MDLIDKLETKKAIAEIESNMSVCLNVDECCGMKRMQSRAIQAIEYMNPQKIKTDKMINLNKLINDLEEIKKAWEKEVIYHKNNGSNHFCYSASLCVHLIEQIMDMATNLANELNYLDV